MTSHQTMPKVEPAPDDAQTGEQASSVQTDLETGKNAPGPIESCNNKTPILRYYQTIPVAVLMGLLFGLSFQKSHVYEPYVIRAQFIFQRWILVKTFFAASGTVLLVFSALSLGNDWIVTRFKNSRDRFVSRCDCPSEEVSIPLLKTVVGGSILGMGMVFGGACPGMVLAQVGSGTHNAWVTLLGCLTGGLAYGLLDPHISSWFKTAGVKAKPLADEFLKLPFHMVAIPMGIFMLGMAIVIEVLVPWYRRLDRQAENVDGCFMFSCRTWPPEVCGVIIGLLEIPAVLIMQEWLGGSTAFVTLIAHGVNSIGLGDTFSYFNKNVTEGALNTWRLVYLLSSILGAFLSTLASNSFAETRGVPGAPAFIGGFMVVFGARVGCGCTSDHGLSGMGMLAFVSIVAVGTIFGVGIVTGQIYNAIAPGTYYKSFD